MNTSEERNNEWINRFSDIDNKRLKKELGTHPRDYSLQKEQFYELMGWFEDTFVQEDIEKGPHLNNDPHLVQLLIKKIRAIQDMHLLPLFAKNNPHISELGWKAFLQFYLSQYIKDNLLFKRHFLRSVNEENFFDTVVEERDGELKMILGTIFGNELLSGKSGKDNQAILLDIAQLELIYDQLKSKNRERYDELSRKAWRKRGLLVTALFVDDIVSREDPLHDMPYLDEFLCYYDSMFFQVLMNDVVFKNVELFQYWITARSDLLADTSSETYKLFCRVFFIGEEGLFDSEGDISPESFIKIQDDFFESLVIVEQKRKLLIAKQESEKEKKLLEETTRQRIETILSQEVTATCSEDFIIALSDIPPEMGSIEINIFRDSRLYARGHIVSPSDTVDLKASLFETFNPQKKQQSWSVISDWKGGHSYQITLHGKIGIKKTPEKNIKSWTEKKAIKNHVDTPRQAITGTLQLPVSGAVEKILQTTPERSIQEHKPTKNPLETEKEDLQTALKLLLMAGYSSDIELQDMLTENAHWDDISETLTLRIPIEEFSELYTPSLLSTNEYGSMTHWTVRKTKGFWQSTPNTLPEELRTYIDKIIDNLRIKKEKEIFDGELSQIGFTLSDDTTNQALKKTIRVDNISHELLKSRIVQFSEQLSETDYRCYTGKIENGVVQSFSLVKKKGWSATLWLVPHLHFVFEIGGKEAQKQEPVLANRLENAVLNILYGCIKKKKTGVSGIVEQTRTLEDTEKLRRVYKKELKKSKARILVENADGSFTILTHIGEGNLRDTISSAQREHGAEKVAILYRRSTYAFVGDNSICKPSPTRSDEDYTSLNLSERREILRERIQKTLFNGKSGVHDRSAFLFNSAVYLTLKAIEKARLESGKEALSREDIDDAFITSFIESLQASKVLISYRDYCAGWVEDLSEVGEE